MIKNLVSIGLPEAANIDLDQLNDALKQAQFTPCGPRDKLQVGWLKQGITGLFARKVGNHLVMKYATEKKAVPGKVLKREVEKLAAEYQRVSGEAAGKKELKMFKQEAEDKLLPHAFPNYTETLVWVDLDHNTINFNVSSMTKAEEAMVSLVRNVANFPATQHVVTEKSPTTAMSGWLIESAPYNFTVDDQCELMLPVEGKPTVKYVRHNLEGEDVKQHIAEGKIPVALSMTYNDRLSFVITDKLLIKGIKPLDIMKEELQEADQEDKEALVDAEFLMLANDLGDITSGLLDELGVVPAQ